MANVLRIPQVLAERDHLVDFNDFRNLTTAQDGVTVAGDTGTGASATVGDTENGVASLVTGAVDNNEILVRSTAELFLAEAGRSLAFETLVQFGVATTDVFVGFASAAGADLITDAGAVRASGSIFGVYKLAAASFWRAHSRINATLTDTASLNPAAISTFYRLRVVVGDYDGTNVYSRFYVDGQELVSDTARGPLPIVHKTPLAGATEMNWVVYAKAGAAAGDTLLADYVCAWQNRNAGF